VAFARISGRDAVIVAVGRLFARSTEVGRHWPAGKAWDALLKLEGFCPIRSALGVGSIMPAGPHWPVRDLFDPIPVAVIEAEARAIERRPRRRRRERIATPESLPAGASSAINRAGWTMPARANDASPHPLGADHCLARDPRL